jgi:hypothetical protein
MADGRDEAKPQDYEARREGAAKRSRKVADRAAEDSAWLLSLGSTALLVTLQLRTRPFWVTFSFG